MAMAWRALRAMVITGNASYCKIGGAEINMLLSARENIDMNDEMAYLRTRVALRNGDILKLL